MKKTEKNNVSESTCKKNTETVVKCVKITNGSNEKRSVSKCLVKPSPIESKINHKVAKACNGNINKPGKQKTSPENTSCDTISVTTTFTTHVTCDENNTPVPNGVSVASKYGLTVVNNSTNDCPLPAQRTFCSLGGSVPTDGSVKDFSDEFLDSRNAYSENTEGVHEAFNTTLVAFQNMDSSEDSVFAHDVFDTHQKNLSESIEPDIIINSDVLEMNDGTSQNRYLANDTNVKGDSSKERARLDMEPRVSFLHGAKSDTKEESLPLNAIYAPGADFFVSRRNSTSSCSSSSSEDQKTITVEVPDSHMQKENILGDVITECHSQLDIECDEQHPSTEIHNNNIELSPAALNLNRKPQVPQKPRKILPINTVISADSGHYAKPSVITKPHCFQNDDEEIYYSVTKNSFNDKPIENHYAEASIYHEINNKVLSIIESGEDVKDGDVRESKLAALAMELEQARHSSSKRHAPSPPRIPEAPLEEPPSSLDQYDVSTSSVIPPNAFRDGIAFSSASSTTSSSSQDDAGFGTWSLSGDADDTAKSSKWKNSFLLAQYSKCKMLAMGYGDDKLRSKKKFSLKKLLKLGKDADFAVHSDSNSSNRKAWKFSDNFDRPRPKLDIIHPMDLENKSVTINPGFDPSRSTTSSFTGGVEIISIRNSTSSDYGTYYSDTASPETQGGTNYEYVTPERCHSSAAQVFNSDCLHSSDSVSPTPSRCSAYSQASTLTSGSSKNGSFPSGSARPPKPPPPPRAHSLLPNGNHTKHIVYKQIPSDDQSSSGGSVFAEETEIPLPQAPRRLFRKSDYDAKSCSSLDLAEPEEDSQHYSSEPVSVCVNGEGEYEFVGRVLQPQLLEQMVAKTFSESETVNQEQEETGRTKGNTLENDDVSSNWPQHTVVSKAPSKPPPMYYSKLSSNSGIRENAWKTLEGSYTALASNNREILLKLVEQAIKRRPFKDHEGMKWQDFKIDNTSPARFYSGGDQVVYDATLETHPVTLLITLKTSESGHFQSSRTQLKHPVFSHFHSSIPSHLLLEETRSDLEMENIQVSVSVLYRCHVTSLDTYIQDIPDVLDENLEKEIAFLLLQVIQELKGFQVQGIEDLDASFKSLLLAKTKEDSFYTLLFTQPDFYEESGSAYFLVMDDCKLSLCQYALSLVFQLFKVESIEELSAIGGLKFSKPTTMKVFESLAILLSEEKAVSLSQSKTLLECFLWNVQSLVHKKEFVVNEADVVFHRWIDIERSHLIKLLVNNALIPLNTQTELHTQFLLRSTVKNIKDITSYL